MNPKRMNNPFAQPLSTSPYTHDKADTAGVMRQVLFAAVPGTLVLAWFFGPGILYNLLLCTLSAVLGEIAALRLRGRPLGFYLRDCSILVTAVLLGVALPPDCPWWIPVSGTLCAVLLGKHVYGGLGYNPFNPAMVGYVVLLISFPVEMTTWGAPRGVTPEYVPPGPLPALQFKLGNAAALDGFTMATPLDLFANDDGMTNVELWAAYPQFGTWGGLGWEWINAAFLLGGLYLLYRGIFSWHAPAGMLGTLLLLSVLFYAGGASNSLGSPLFHLFSGATMLGAFFILTDPVSSATSKPGRLVFGIGAGILLFVMRGWSNYPDAIAFCVLLMNFCAPLIDRYTIPRVYGHEH